MQRRIPLLHKALWTLGLAAFLTQAAFTQALNVQVHDPVMIKQDDTFYIFFTGRGVSVLASKDMKNWESAGRVFEQSPAWTTQRYSDFRGSMWAPDITLHNGVYYLYYSVSAFGSNNSTIGVATNKTLRSDDPAFKWEDHGPIVESVRGRDLFNAIDPNLAFDDAGTPWLTFGSFWLGMKQVKLKENLTEVAQPEVWYTVAARNRYWKLEEADAGDELSSAIEAPFLFRKNGLYYLFVSWDRCCRGKDSTYKVVAGRSNSINGPFLDKEGEPMQFGGGSLVVGGNADWPGVGHNSAYTFDGKDYLVFHGYPATGERGAKLWIEEIQWDANGWPSVSLD